VVDHLHLHVVPRWSGDNNFMPVIGNTKIHSLSLDDTFRTLARGFRQKRLPPQKTQKQR
jgi:ATP adenylyltransferase